MGAEIYLDCDGCGNWVGENVTLYCQKCINMLDAKISTQRKVIISLENEIEKLKQERK